MVRRESIQDYEIKYETYKEMPEGLCKTMDFIKDEFGNDIKREDIKFIIRETGISPNILHETYSFPLEGVFKKNVIENREVKTGADRQRIFEIRKKIKKYGGIKPLMSQDEGEFLEFTEAFRNFIEGGEIGLYNTPVFEKYETVEDIDGQLSKNNRYLKLLYMASENERSFRRMCSRLDIHNRRLSTLVEHLHGDYNLFEKGGSYIKTSERGKEFLYKLFPYLEKSAEDSMLTDYLEENVRSSSF